MHLGSDTCVVSFHVEFGNTERSLRLAFELPVEGTPVPQPVAYTRGSQYTLQTYKLPI